MLFGRQRNMVRRKFRPHESYHRDMRRKAVDRTAMLESRFGKPRKRSLIDRILNAIFGR